MVAFGENDVFYQVANPPESRLRRFQNAMTKFCSFSPPIFRGRGFFSSNFGILPYRRPINVVGML
jgi:2-acylglycerol O-acyltransferase 2